MKRMYVLIVATLVILTGLGLNSSKAFVFENNKPYAYCSDNLLRLHIVANSSSPADQYLKRQIRDVILHETGGFFRNVNDLDSAVEVTSINLPNLQRKVEEFLRSQGKEIPVYMELGRFDFPTRTYGGITLPAGEYQALQVILGVGTGNNWWCVLFPPLCMEDNETLTEEEKRQLLILPYDPKNVEVEYRFALLEKLNHMPTWLIASYLEIARLTVLGKSQVVQINN